MEDNIRGRRIHFMGIGGIGMSALAELALARGAVVSGCDREEGERVRRLRGLGIPVHSVHDAAHAAGVDELVYTSAVPADHPERRAANGKGVRRGVLLARCMAPYRTLGVAGAHGKTTTTALAAQLMAPLAPTVMVGGLVRPLGGNFKPGRAPGDGGVFVAELDESDGSFLEPRLDAAVVTNIDADHLAYYGDTMKYYRAFEEFVGRMPGGATLIVNGDNLSARVLGRSMADAGRLHVHTCGVERDADWRARDRAVDSGGQTFRLVVGGRMLDEGFRLPLFGEHNLMNALLAMAAAHAFGVPMADLRAELARVEGPVRRAEMVGRIGHTPVYSDYAHHPTEIRAAIAGLREKEKGPLLLVFQPHLYSRTRDHAEDFGAALAEADEVMLVDLFPAREAPIAGVDAGTLAAAAAAHGARVGGTVPVAGVLDAVRERAGDFGVVALVGAGNIGEVADAVAAAGM